MKDTKITQLEIGWKRNIQTHSMWIGITDEMQNRTFKEHNWIQLSFKVDNRQTAYVERQDKDESESMTNNLQ
jgi:hypothetical protein